MSREIKRVLVIQTGSIGEFVLSLAAMKRIRQAHPHARITLLTTSPFEALAKSSPYFNEVLSDGRPQAPGDWLRLRGAIRRARFDRVYDLDGSASSSMLFNALRPFPPIWSGPASGAKLRHANPHRAKMHTLERHAEQLKIAGIWPDAPTGPGEAPAPDLSWILRRAPQARPVPGAAAPKPFVLLVPGGSEAKPEKRWPVAKYAELAGLLHRRGYDIVIVGGPQESAMARTIQRTVGQARDLTGRTDFAQIAVLGARAALAIGNNTGPMHLIAAAGAPTITLYASASGDTLSGPRGHVAMIHADDMSQLAVQTVAQAAFSLLPQ